MRSQCILSVLAPCVALVTAQDAITTEAGHEAKLEARFIVTLSTSWADYSSRPTGLLTDPNAYSTKSMSTTLKTVTRPPNTDAKPTSTLAQVLAAQESITTPGYRDPMEPGLEYATMGQHIVLYGTHSEEDINALGMVVSQAKNIYGGEERRCYAKYRTSKYLPGADVTGYLQSRILTCENGYSLRLGTRDMGTAKSEMCQYVGITFAEKLQNGIKDGKGKKITPHNVEDENYRLIASAYLRRSVWDLRFGYEKKGCPPKDGTDEEKAEYVMTFNLEEWKKYGNDNPGVWLYDWGDLLGPPPMGPTGLPRAPTMGELPPNPHRTPAPTSVTAQPDPVTSEMRVTEQTPAITRRDEATPVSDKSDTTAAPTSTKSSVRSIFLDRLIKALGEAMQTARAPDPTPTAMALEDPPEYPANPTPLPFDPADPTFCKLSK
ncbi:hypothetical protein TWF679_010362 [Orbilia oligospora]|uniref:Uncharacterized protein n=1 Tax=Orbilia oligospora TaxID=2813651 RepID=A0A8H8VJ05_ORBOL|nr:hypothetical protein TWF679_010362 [Orbilia oligospora]